MVKIERKIGIKKIRISHNKKLFWIIISLLVLLGILIFFIIAKKPEDNIKDTEFACEKDSDCIKVQTGCCSCSMGGEEKCVSNPEKQKYEDILRNCDKQTMCIAMFACNIESCSCVDNKCSIVNN